MFFFLLFFFGVGKDAFVLCRVFHKSNIGPPSGQRYTPFIEEDWDDGKLAYVVICDFIGFHLAKLCVCVVALWSMLSVGQLI